MTQTINSSLFTNNRKHLAERLLPNSIAVFNANDIMPTNADGTMRFKQNSDLFYLTGVNQEETILLIFPDAIEEKNREILFLRETSEYLTIWEGKKLTKEEAKEATGIQNVQWLSSFDNLFRQLMTNADNIYLNTNEHNRASVVVESRDLRFIHHCKELFPLHSYHRLAPIMQNLREIKSPEEIACMRKACEITEKGFRRILKFVKPGVMEYEIEAEYAHEFIRNGAGFADYQAIVASGPSACVLHYVENNKACNDGELLLMDTAAGYMNYNADMTRTIPVNGRFTARQRQVYDAVHRVMKLSTKFMKPGITKKEWHDYTEEITTKECVDLGLFTMDEVKNQDKNKPLVKKYFMHGVGHYLGLDVHDVGDMYAPFRAGNVWTVEPGIYIVEEGIGVRLENNILITANGNEDLMATIPLDAGEIEELMNA
ncbi:MAG TPA: aminopeptidase P N-terminal domain-containing protein [Candidatus Kapabacteria bacterium]